jgi:hypothetical protein
VEEGGSAGALRMCWMRGWCLGVVQVVLLFSCGVAALDFALLSLCLFSLSCCAVLVVEAPAACGT